MKRELFAMIELLRAAKACVSTDADLAGRELDRALEKANYLLSLCPE
jgi:hypothetical protein